jgi:hypothetical protein
MRRTAHLTLLAFLPLVASGCDRGTPVSPPPSTLSSSVPALDLGDGRGPPFVAPTTYAVIGDIPYGLVKRRELPNLIEQINADGAVSAAIHLGDIRQGKNGEDPLQEPLGGCADAQLLDIRSVFDGFTKPLVYTPGDNEWTDCHHDGKKNGYYVPTERLQRLRQIFFPIPGVTLGAPRLVLSQAFDPRHSDYVENVMWMSSGVVFAAVNIPGSDNDASPWGTLPAGADAYPSQQEEQDARGQADADWIDAAFAAATALHSPGLVLAFQADFWNKDDPVSHLAALTNQIGMNAIKFGKPVLLLEGDSHLFRVDHPYTPFEWSSKQPTAPFAPNVLRIVVEGELNPTEYLRLTIDPRSPAGLFSWTRVPYIPPPPTS